MEKNSHKLTDMKNKYTHRNYFMYLQFILENNQVFIDSLIYFPLFVNT